MALAFFCLFYPMKGLAGVSGNDGGQSACTFKRFWMSSGDRKMFAQGRTPESVRRDKAYVAFMDAFWGSLDADERKYGSPILVGDLLENMQRAFRNAAREHQRKIGQHGIRISLVFSRAEVAKEFTADQLKNPALYFDKDVKEIIGQDGWAIAVRFANKRKPSNFADFEVSKRATAQTFSTLVNAICFEERHPLVPPTVFERKIGCNKLGR